MTDPAVAQAMKARVTVLARMGLATENRRGMFVVAPDWRARLESLEAHADIRRRVLRERTAARGQDREGDGNVGRLTRAEAGEHLARDAGKPFESLGMASQRWRVRGELEIGGKTYLSLERHDRVALAPKPPGLQIAPGDQVMAGMKGGLPRIVSVIGLDR